MFNSKLTCFFSFSVKGNRFQGSAHCDRDELRWGERGNLSNILGWERCSFSINLLLVLVMWEIRLNFSCNSRPFSWAVWMALMPESIRDYLHLWPSSGSGFQGCSISARSHPASYFAFTNDEDLDGCRRWPKQSDKYPNHGNEGQLREIQTQMQIHTHTNAETKKLAKLNI